MTRPEFSSGTMLSNEGYVCGPFFSTGRGHLPQDGPKRAVALHREVPVAKKANMTPELLVKLGPDGRELLVYALKVITRAETRLKRAHFGYFLEALAMTIDLRKSFYTGRSEETPL